MLLETDDTFLYNPTKNEEFQSFWEPKKSKMLFFSCQATFVAVLYRTDKYIWWQSVLNLISDNSTVKRQIKWKWKLCLVQFSSFLIEKATSYVYKSSLMVEWENHKDWIVDVVSHWWWFPSTALMSSTVLMAPPILLMVSLHTTEHPIILDSIPSQLWQYSPER